MAAENTQKIAEKLTMSPKFYKRISVINFGPIYGIRAQEKENSIVYHPCGDICK